MGLSLSLVLSTILLISSAGRVFAVGDPEHPPMREDSMIGGSGEKLQGIDPIPLYLRPDSLRKRPLPQGDLVRLSPEEFGALTRRYAEWVRAEETRRDQERRKLEKAWEEKARKPPCPELRKSATLTAVGSGETLKVTAELELKVLDPRPGEILILDPAALESAESSEPADLLASGPDPGTLALTATGPGTRTIRLIYHVPIVTDGASPGSLRASIPLPRAVRQELSLSLAEGVSGLSVRDAPELIVIDGSRTSRSVRVQGTQARTVEVSWVDATTRALPGPSPSPVPSAAPAVKDVKPRITAHLEALYAIGERTVRFNTTLMIKSSRQGISTLDVLVPLGASLESVEGPNVQGHDLSVKDGQKVLTLGFKEPVRDETSVTLVGEASLPETSEGIQKVTLPMFRIPEALRVQGAAGICAFSTFHVKSCASTSGEVAILTPQDLDEGITSKALSPVLLGFKYIHKQGAAAPGVGLELERYQSLRTLSTLIRELNAVTVLTPGSERTGESGHEAYLQSLTRVVFKITNAQGRFLSVTLPKGAQILACFVDLLPQPPVISRVTDAGQEFLIALKRSEVQGGEMIPYPVEIAYRMDIHHGLSSRGQVDIPFPILSAPVIESSWNVFFPERYRAHEVSGTFHWATGERDLVLLTYGREIFEFLILFSLRALLILILPLTLLVLIRTLTTRGQAASTGFLDRILQKQLILSAMLLIAILGVLAAIAVPNFQKARARANTRACFANQKTIAGGMEMYNLDKNVNSTDVAGMLPQLVKDGYLQSTPMDPGSSAQESWKNYEYVGSGNGIRCRVHGSIDGH